MEPKNVSRATLGRLPLYLKELETLRNEGRITVSATVLAERLKLGDVQVRKDLNSVCDTGRPRIGYRLEDLEGCIKALLGCKEITPAAVVGTNRLALALLEYEGFEKFGIRLNCTFSLKDEEGTDEISGKPILPAKKMAGYCAENRIALGVIATGKAEGQKACDLLCAAGVTAVWNLSGADVTVPETVTLRSENLALSLAHLNLRSNG